MTKVESKFNGDFAEGLDKLGALVSGEVSMAGSAAMAQVFYTEVRLNASRNIKTGTLYEAIYRVFVKERSYGAQKIYRTSWNRSKAPHGHLIEFGTSKSPAFPFVRPAMDQAPAAIDAGLERMQEKYKELKGKS